MQQCCIVYGRMLYATCRILERQSILVQLVEHERSKESLYQNIKVWFVLVFMNEK